MVFEMIRPNAQAIFNTNPNDATTGEGQALLDGFRNGNGVRLQLPDKIALHFG